MTGVLDPQDRIATPKLHLIDSEDVAAPGGRLDYSNEALANDAADTSDVGTARVATHEVLTRKRAMLCKQRE